MPDHIVVRELAKRTARRAVRGVSFSVARDEIFGLLGPNGRGEDERRSSASPACASRTAANSRSAASTVRRAPQRRRKNRRTFAGARCPTRSRRASVALFGAFLSRAGGTRRFLLERFALGRKAPTRVSARCRRGSGNG